MLELKLNHVSKRGPRCEVSKYSRCHKMRTWLCFVFLRSHQYFLVVSSDEFNHLIQGCFTGIWAIVWWPQWSNPEACWYNPRASITPTKHTRVSTYFWRCTINSLAPGRPGCHFKTAIWILLYWLSSSDLLMIMHPDECHGTSRMISQHWFR